MEHNYREKGKSQVITPVPCRLPCSAPRTQASGVSHFSGKVTQWSKGLYPGWSHSEIVEYQNEKLRDVMASSSLDPSFDRGGWDCLACKPRRLSCVPVSKLEGDSETFLDAITDSRGRIRLSLLRNRFKFEKIETGAGRDTIVSCYQKWVDCVEYLKFAVRNVITGRVEKEICVKCSKRGNDVYRWRLDRRLGWLDDFEYAIFFNSKDRDVRGETTRMLFVVLTYDAKRCSRREAWENINRDWNRWIAAVRKRYGKIKYFKSFEAFKNGYPHVNAVLLFGESEFEVSYRDRNKRFRILRRDKDWLDEKWHSHVDVQACYSTSVFSYLKKYMLKTYGEKNDVRGVSKDQAKLTVALLWLFRKQSFSISEGMQEVVFDLISEMHNSNSISFQITLAGISLYEYELVDVVTLQELCLGDRPPPNVASPWRFELPYRPSLDTAVSHPADPCQVKLSPTDFWG